MSIATESTAKLITEPAEVYHARSEISRGQLWDFFESPRLYEGRHILGTIPPKESTPAMKKGTLAHAALLEPASFAERYVVMPRYELDADNVTAEGEKSTSTATSYYKAKKAAFKKVNAGKNLVNQDEYDMIRGMASSMARECGAWLKSDGIVERTVVWDHPTTGIRCRCRLDWARFTNRSTVIIFDLKGTADPRPRAFRNRIEDGLWLQAAHYSEGAAIAFGMPVENFVFVASEFDEPHRTFTYTIDSQSMRSARDAREDLMNDLACRLGSGDWSDPQEGQITSVSVRDFAFKRGE
jgi:hypothetical protein